MIGAIIRYAPHSASWVLIFACVWTAVSAVPALFAAVFITSIASASERRCPSPLVSTLRAAHFVQRYLNILGLAAMAVFLYWKVVLEPLFGALAVAWTNTGSLPNDSKT